MEPTRQYGEYFVSQNADTFWVSHGAKQLMFQGRAKVIMSTHLWIMTSSEVHCFRFMKDLEHVLLPKSAGGGIYVESYWKHSAGKRLPTRYESVLPTGIIIGSSQFKELQFAIWLATKSLVPDIQRIILEIAAL